MFIPGDLADRGELTILANGAAHPPTPVATDWEEDRRDLAGQPLRAWVAQQSKEQTW